MATWPTTPALPCAARDLLEEPRRWRWLVLSDRGGSSAVWTAALGSDVLTLRIGAPRTALARRGGGTCLDLATPIFENLRLAGPATAGGSAGVELALVVGALTGAGHRFAALAIDGALENAFEILRWRAAGSGEFGCAVGVLDERGPRRPAPGPAPGFVERHRIDRRVAAAAMLDAVVAASEAAGAAHDALCERFHHPYSADAVRRARVVGDIATAIASAEARPAGSCGPTEAVDFVVPHRNHARHLDGALGSISRCSRPGDGVIVVDDGSEAEQAAAAERLARGHGAVFAAAERAEGPAAARWRGVCLGRNPLVQFLDADDALIPEGVARARAFLAREPDCDMTVGAMWVEGRARSLWTPSDGLIWTAPFVNFGHSGFMARRSRLRREDFSNAPGDRFEDWETNMRLVARGLRCAALPTPSYRYLCRPNSRNETDIAGREAAWIAMQSILAPVALESRADPQRLAVLLQIGMDGGASGDMREGLPLVAYKARYRVLDRVLRVRPPTARDGRRR